MTIHHFLKILTIKVLSNSIIFFKIERLMSAEYRKVLSQFQKLGLGYTENSQLRKSQVQKALDQIIRNNTGTHEYDRIVADQLWQNSTQGQFVLLRDYINSIVQGQSILRNRIRTSQDQLKFATSQEEKNRRMDQIFTDNQDLKMLTTPFALQIAGGILNMVESKNQQAKARESGIFQVKPSEHEHSWGLRVTFILCVIGILIQLFAMFHKHHFYSLLCFFMVISVFFLDYFDKIYIRTMMVNLGISVLLDVAWIFCMASPYWYTVAQTQHSTINDFFLKIYWFLVFVVAGIKTFIIILFIRYTKTDESLRKRVVIFGLKFTLHSRPNNIITDIISGHRP